MTENGTETSPSNQGVLIFGASGAIGRTLAKRLATAGVAVHLAGRDVAGLAGELGSSHSVVDVADSATFAAAVNAAQSSLPALTGVVNCIGSILLKPAHQRSAVSLMP